MNRSKDLDTIAPDDLIVNSSHTSNDSISNSSSQDKIEEEQFVKPQPQSKQKIHDILGHSKNSLSSFLVNPKNFDFPEREQDEEVFLAVRSHWLINFKWIILTIVMIFAPLFLGFLDFFSSIPFKNQLISVIFWYILTFIYAYEKFLNWYFDVFIITNQRLVDIKFNNLLNKHFAEVDIGKIQDVSSSIKGLFGTFFNFGNILIQTASEINQVTFRNVPNPEKIIKLFQELRLNDTDINQGEHQ